MSDAIKPQLHGRDHRAGGRDPIPGLGLLDSAFMYCSTTGGSSTTISNNSLTSVVFDQISIASGSKAFAVRTAVPTYRPIKAVLNGWYVGYVNFEWSGSVYTDVRSYGLWQNNFYDNCGSQYDVQHQSAPQINSAFNGTFGPHYIRGASLSDSYFTLDIHHQAGSTQTITGVIVTLIYLGEDLDAARMPPF